MRVDNWPEFVSIASGFQFREIPITARNPSGARVKASRLTRDATDASAGSSDYRLEDQIGFVLRRANQRHTTIFQEEMIDGLTPTQFAALVQLDAAGPCSQNHLGRLTAMDIATIKGVVERLRTRGLVTIEADLHDRRRRSLTLSDAGRRLVRQATSHAKAITARTLEPLNADEARQLLALLARIA